MTRDNWADQVEAEYGQRVVVTTFPSAGSNRQVVGVKVLGPRGGIRGHAWFYNPEGLDEVIDLLLTARDEL